jgi:hypothetical protein
LPSYANGRTEEQRPIRWVLERLGALALGNWARQNGFNLMFEVRGVRNLDVLYVMLKAR